MGLNYKEESRIDETRAIFVRVQQDGDNEGCVNTEPKPFRVHLMFIYS